MRRSRMKRSTGKGAEEGRRAHHAGAAELEAALLDDPARAGVGDTVRAPQGVHPAVGEGAIDEGLGGFGGEAAAPPRRTDPQADLDGGGQFLPRTIAGAAKDRAVRPIGDDEGAVVGKRNGGAEVLGDGLVGRQRRDCRQIRRHGVPQHQPGGHDRFILPSLSFLAAVAHGVLRAEQEKGRWCPISPFPVPRRVDETPAEISEAGYSAAVIDGTTET